jgi:FdrA protein
MPTGFIVRKNEFYDSVFLMRVAKRIAEQPGVQQSAALMATEKNKAMLAEIHVRGAEIDAASPNDLIVAVVADSAQTVRAVLDRLDDWLRREPISAQQIAPRTLDSALEMQPNSNLVVISVPGAYAAHEARRALERGVNAFIFSSNVSVEDEIALKQFARERGLIVMGPDCGTAIISGIGIGFANVVRRGTIGVIGAAGTGLQEFTTLVHHAGAGISHAIGTGGRDLSDAIGGISALTALDALERDAATKVIAIISKPPGTQTLARLIERIARCSKPVVTCFLGQHGELPGANIRFRVARTLDDAAALAVQIANGKPPLETTFNLQSLISDHKAQLKPTQKYLRGIFAGGTLCYQAQQILQDMGVRVYSNAPLSGNFELPDPHNGVEHTIVDMGAEFFTDGRAHPMIDATLRRERILAEAQDPQVAVLLLDFILGYNASADPVGDLVDVIARARDNHLIVVASVCGTEGDPQGLHRQIELLEKAGAIILPSGAQAARVARMLVQA